MVMDDDVDVNVGSRDLGMVLAPLKGLDGRNTTDDKPCFDCVLDDRELASEYYY